MLAIIADGGEPEAYIGAAFAAIWQEERDLSERAELAAVLRAAGYDADRLLDQANAASIEAGYALNQETAIKAGVFGLPAYDLDGELFWGQDRLDFLDEALTSGRSPYRPL